MTEPKDFEFAPDDRIGYLEQLYEHIRARPGVLMWTGEQILDWYRPLAKS